MTSSPILTTATLGLMGLAGVLVGEQTAGAQSVRSQQASSPQARMRPLGSPSLVDQFRRPQNSLAQTQTGHAQFFETSYREVPLSGSGSRPSSSSQVASFGQPGRRQTVRQFQLPNPGAPAVSPQTLTPQTFPPQTVAPSTTPPIAPAPNRTLPSPPARSFGGNQLQSPSDLAPLSPPALNSSFANIGNSCCVSGPSGYSAAFPTGCRPVNFQTPVAGTTPFTNQPAQVPAPVVLPGGGFSAPAVASAAPAPALVTFGQETQLVQVGQGLIGQPKAYVPGQTFRNWLRYLTP